MPELPEVETIRRDLEKKILNTKITGVQVPNPGSLKNPAKQFERELKFQRLKQISRRGKLLILHMESNKFLLIHLKMTGQLILQNNTLKGTKTNRAGYSKKHTMKVPNKHTRVILMFENGSKLYFNDIRKFGYMHIVSEEEKSQILKNYGIEPLTENFKFEDFQKCFNKKKTSVKNILLNQKLIAGLGNIYADEVCHQSAILPQKTALKLSQEEIQNLFKNCKKVLKTAIREKGTSFSDYRDGRGEKGNYLKHLKVYGREGQECFKCRELIRKIKNAGRGTHFCLSCQN